MSQEDFGRLVGFSRQTINGWEGGKPLRMSSLQRIASKTGKRLTYFVSES